MVITNERYPDARTERELKIALFSDVMEHFDKGKVSTKSGDFFAGINVRK